MNAVLRHKGEEHIDPCHGTSSVRGSAEDHRVFKVTLVVMSKRFPAGASCIYNFLLVATKLPKYVSLLKQSDDIFFTWRGTDTLTPAAITVCSS